MNQQELLELIERAAVENWAVLDLSFKWLTELPPEIGKLTSLIWLSLGGNMLVAVPPEIGKLTALTELNLFDNQLTAIPSEIGKLAILAKLDLSWNKLTVLPMEVEYLTRLRSLYLHGNELTVVPQEIGKLTNLTRLDLDYNGLIIMPPEIRKLTSLTSLGLSNNQLMAVPPEIEYLTNLTSLSLSNNQITAVPPEIARLTSLTSLNLRSNQLTHLPKGLQRLTQLEELDLRDNPALGISPEVLEQINNPSLILKTYFGERRSLREAKMLLVGQGGVGKTALARRLIHNLPPDKNQGKTPGVDINKWQITPSSTSNPQSLISDPITLNLWDFGGQGVYQATHQFFFTARSLYLIVVNARTGEHESRLNHWLNLVASLSDNAPAIIVVNQQDLHSLQLDERALKEKYRNLLAIIPTSCVSGSGIPELRAAIVAAIAHLPHVNDQFPLKWLELKAKLETMKTNYITYDRYAEYCRDAGITERRDQRSWGRVLHQLGIILNYQDDNYRQLESTHVLKPEWVTDGVYRILSDPGGQITANNGILTPAMLDAILDPNDYPRYQQAFIVGMMQKFELSYPLPNRPGHHLIPDLLPKNQPAETEFFTKTQFLEFQIHYTEFLPASILSRFMVGMMAALDRHASWRSGAVLQFDGNPALVRADLEARKIYITVAGPEATRRSLLNAIRMQLHAIHATFPNLPLSEEVPIPNHPGKTIAYEELLWYESEGMLNPPYAPVRGKIDVKALLDGIETPALRYERQLVEQLRQTHGLDELHDLCHELNVEYEDLPGQTKTAKTRELVDYLGRNGRLHELETVIRR